MTAKEKVDKANKELDFNEFAALPESAQLTEVKFIPPFAAPSEFSGAQAAYFENVVHYPDGALSILYNSEADLSFMAGTLKVKASFRQIRPRIKPTFNKILTRLTYPSLFEGVDAGVTELQAEEYALLPGRTYFAKIDKENYYLPPTGPGKGPQTRYRTVLSIVEPGADLTPVFKNWR